MPAKVRAAYLTVAKCVINVAMYCTADPLFNGGHWIADMLDAAGAEYSMNVSKAPSGKRSCMRLLCTL
jgi:hypothetical protein